MPLAATFDLILDVAKLGAWDWDLETGKIVWSPTQRRLFGLDDDETVTLEKFVERVVAEDRAAVRDQTEAMIGGTPASRNDVEHAFRIRGQDGAIRHIGGRSRVVRDADDRAVRAVGINWDSTASVHREAVDRFFANRRAAAAVDNARHFEEARRAVAAREEVLAIVTHDLRSPLQAISMSASMILRMAAQEEGSRAHRRHAELIQRAGNRMTRLVEDLIDFASIERGALNIVPSGCDAGAIGEEAVEGFAATAHERGLSLVFEPSPEKLEISCDRARILQVLDNLIMNAMNVTDSGGKIAVTLHPTEKGVLYSVRDTGPGIPHELLERIFERYVRREETQYRGRGLGLAIARGIVKAHGGRIWAESTVGSGACFSFELPRERTSP